MSTVSAPSLAEPDEPASAKVLEVAVPPAADALADTAKSPSVTDAAAAAASAVPSSSSCSADSLRDYYDACADFYDEADEGTDNTYVCVDRVSASLIAAMHRLFTPVESSEQEVPSDDAPVHTNEGLAAPLPLAPLAGALSLLSLAPTPTDDSQLLSAASSASLSLTPSPRASPLPLRADTDSPTTTLTVTSSSSCDDSESDMDRAPSSLATSLLSPSPLSLSSTCSLDSCSSDATSCIAPSPPSSSAPLTRAQQLHVSSGTPLRILDLGVGTGLASRPLFAALSVPKMSFEAPRSSSGSNSTGADEPPRAPSVPPGALIPEIWGCDLSTGMLRVSGRALPFAHLIPLDLNTDWASHQLYPSSPLASPSAQAYFDMVLCVGTTEFVQDHRKFLHQAREFLRPGGLFAGTFPCTHSQTYPDMSCVDGGVEGLTRLVDEEVGGFDVIELQQYRGWSVSAEEHVEYIQILAQKRR